MHRLEIHNFGPIKDATIDIEPTKGGIDIFIGPQASGKSTIAKLVKFFLQFISNSTPAVFRSKEFQLGYNELVENMEKMFYELFGIHYSSEAYVNYYLKDGENDKIELNTESGKEKYFKIHGDDSIRSFYESIYYAHPGQRKKNPSLSEKDISNRSRRIIRQAEKEQKGRSNKRRWN